MSVKECIKLTTISALEKIKDILSNKIHNIEICKNKGIVGHFIETSIGLTFNSDCLDLLDGEIKAFPLKKNKKSDILVSKETIAITMTDRESLKNDKFDDTKLYKKIENIIFVPYLRKTTKVLIFEPILIKLSDNKIVYDNIKKDYENIQNTLLQQNQIQSKIGVYIQSRTKGAKNKKTRAYYFKKLYIQEYIIPHINYTDNNKNLINEVLY
jgi:DNA mismatch repair protein MutH